jgi:hypothetical protein
MGGVGGENGVAPRMLTFALGSRMAIPEPESGEVPELAEPAADN